MCFISVMMDAGRMQIQQEAWTRPALTDFQEIINRLAALDQKLGLADCADPAKATWMAEIEKRLRALEGSPK